MSIDKSYWTKRDVILTASAKGFNYLREIPKLLKEAYPFLREVEFGFFIEEDCPLRLIDGWIFLKKEHFPDYESFNAVMPERFGVRPTSDGRFMVKNNYVMIMDKDYRKEYRKAVQDLSDKTYQDITQSERPTPEGADGVVKFHDTTSEFLETKSSPSPVVPNEARRRGRPPKEK